MINRWTLGVPLMALVLVGLAALLVIAADALGDDGDGPQYKVRVNFGSTVTQNDINEVESILRSLDPDVDFILAESFPPIGSATVKSDSEDACKELKALKDKEYVAEVTVDCDADTGGTSPALSGES